MDGGAGVPHIEEFVRHAADLSQARLNHSRPRVVQLPLASPAGMPLIELEIGRGVRLRISGAVDANLAAAVMKALPFRQACGGHGQTRQSSQGRPKGQPHAELKPRSRLRPGAGATSRRT